MSTIQHSASGSIPAITFIRLFFSTKSFPSPPFTLWKHGVTKRAKNGFLGFIPLGFCICCVWTFSYQRPSSTIANSLLAADRATLIGRSFPSSSLEGFVPTATRSGSSNFLFVCFFCYYLRAAYCTFLFRHRNARCALSETG